MKNNLFLQAAVSGLLLAASCSTSNASSKSMPEVEQKSSEMMGQCHGMNACKGTGACGGADHSCHGKNECKGKGWVMKSKTECESAGGTFKEHKSMM